MSGKLKGKTYEQLTFTDDFMFCKILQSNPDLCKELTELILGRKVGKIVQIQQQNPINITADGKGVRFDVYMTDDQNCIYDIEMQKAEFRELPKRSRYYQGMIDLDDLGRGIKYSELKRSYVIFICMANLFPEKGLHKYSFVYTCREDKSLELDDGSCKVFLSAKGTADDVSGEMQGFLAYLETQTCETGLTRKIHAELEKARNHERWRVEYMTLLERDERMRAEGREEGRAEGREEGREEGRTEGIEEGLERGIFGLIKVLLGMDMPVEEIKDKIVTTYSISQDKAEEYLKAATSVSPAE